jgi:hypothetical protein
MDLRLPHERDLDRQRVIRLRESEFDLQTELADLADEITWRHERIAVILQLLRQTRADLASIEAVAA